MWEWSFSLSGVQVGIIGMVLSVVVGIVGFMVVNSKIGLCLAIVGGLGFISSEIFTFRAQELLDKQKEVAAIVALENSIPEPWREIYKTLREDKHSPELQIKILEKFIGDNSQRLCKISVDNIDDFADLWYRDGSGNRQRVMEILWPYVSIEKEKE